MSVTSDIVASWRQPRVIVRRLLGQSRSEAFAFTLLLVALLLLFISLMPYLARQAYFAPAQPLSQRLFGAGLAILATIPLWYLLAALGHLVARLMGGQGTFYGARIALFWALVAISPALLLAGLVQGMVGLGTASNILGLLVMLGFLMFWSVNLREVEG
ncbi:MAG: YIP1 family protein [bacterium]